MPQGDLSYPYLCGGDRGGALTRGWNLSSETRAAYRDPPSAAESFLSVCPSPAELDRLEASLLERRDEVPLLVHLAVKLARSRRIVEEIDRTRSESAEPDAKPLRVSVVFAMFREHERILPIGMHPHGEDFLVRKIEQLEWLLGDLPSLSWEMIAVDDGCPDGSGRVAPEILAERAPDAPVRVTHRPHVFGPVGTKCRIDLTAG